MQKKNIPLILGIAIPILLIIIVAFSIYLPGVFAHPKYNFIYSNGTGPDPYYCSYSQYSVQNGKLQKVDINYNQSYNQPLAAYPQPYCKDLQPIKLYNYDPAQNQSQEIPFEQAQQYLLDSGSRSPDGFEIVSGTSGSFLFGSFNDYNSKYIKGHGASKKLNLSFSNNNYYNFTFLGWIIK